MRKLPLPKAIFVILATALAFMPVAGLLVTAAHAAAPVAHFPPVTSENLSGKTFHLPADLEGDRNLLLIAFQREQQKNIDTWLRGGLREALRFFHSADVALVDAARQIIRDQNIRFERRSIASEFEDNTLSGLDVFDNFLRAVTAVIFLKELEAIETA